jgi:hypothetical protein
MSENQFEKRSLFKAFSRSFSSFSRLLLFFRSRSTSEQGRASPEQERASLEQERASSSVVESDTSDQELQRIVRDESSEKLINEYVRRRFQSYLDNNVEDVDLWKSIYYDFEYFTERIWKMISSDNWIFIKKICLTQEFWLNQADSKDSRSKIMYKVSKKNYYADWTLNQIERVEKTYEKLSRDTQIRKNKLQSFSVQLSSIQLSSSSLSQAFRSSFSSIETHQNDVLSEIRTYYESNTRIRQNRYADVRNSQFYSDARYDDRNRQFNSESRFDSNRIRTRQYEISEYALENLYTVNEIRRALSKRHIYASEFYDQSDERSDNYTKEIISLSKIYRDEDRFSDSKDNFEFKLLIFFDRCSQVNLSKHAYLKAVSIMLSDQTLTYYYSNKVTYFTFDDFCINMRTYFENSEWQRSNLDKWQTLSLRDVIAVNSNVSLTECLRKLCAKMSTIQRELDSAYHDSTLLRENIIQTCRDHSVLIFELINSSMNISRLINILELSIINYEIVRKFFVQQQHQYHQNQYHQTKDEIDDHYFIDRQYRREERDESSFDHRDESRDRNDWFQINRRSKKCFVCEKLDCWSINPFEKKRDDSKKRFSNRYSQYKIRQEFDRRLNQYIADFESIIKNESNDEYVTQYFDELTISFTFEIDIIKLIEFESDELFLTSFDEFQDIESFINALADKTFQHRLISKNIINVLINESFDFTYTSIIDSRYDDNEFKDILVNCDAADRSTDDMKQFKTLQSMKVKTKKLIKTILKMFMTSCWTNSQTNETFFFKNA